MKEALQKVIPTMTDFDMDKAVKNAEDMIKTQQAAKYSAEKKLFNKKAPLNSRIAASRGMRNATYHELIPKVLELAADKSEDLELRLNVVEMLGWFNKSMHCKAIADGCAEILKDKTIEPELRAELIQTINRVK